MEAGAEQPSQPPVVPAPPQTIPLGGVWKRQTPDHIYIYIYISHRPKNDVFIAWAPDSSTPHSSTDKGLQQRLVTELCDSVGGVVPRQMRDSGPSTHTHTHIYIYTHT